MQSPPPAVFHDKYQWEIWKNTAGKSATPFPRTVNFLPTPTTFTFAQTGLKMMFILEGCPLPLLYGMIFSEEAFANGHMGVPTQPPFWAKSATKKKACCPPLSDCQTVKRDKWAQSGQDTFDLPDLTSSGTWDICPLKICGKNKSPSIVLRKAAPFHIPTMLFVQFIIAIEKGKRYVKGW